MPARGTDDLAALANSFNEMAASLQDKLRELEELSKVQRQFVSDVSHELRTPLTTIRIAADVLFEAREQLDPAAGRSRRAAAEPAGAVRGAARRPAGDQQVRRERGDPGRRVGRRVRPGAAGGRGRGAAGGPQGHPDRVPAAARAVRRRGGPPPGGAGPAQPARQRGRARRGPRRGGHRRRRPGRGGGRGPRPRGGLRAGRAVSSSSTGSGGPTRPGPGPPAAPGSAWPSRWRTPGCTAAGCRPGGSAGRARCSGSPCRARWARSWPDRRCRSVPTRPRWPRPSAPTSRAAGGRWPVAPAGLRC